MAYKKFDDPALKVDTSARKIYSNPSEVFRRGIQGIANRVLGSTAGTSSAKELACCGTGATGGFKTTALVVVLIIGVYSTCIAQDNLRMPAGTQGKNTAAKYLISTGTGTSGTVTGPGNVVSCADYDTNTLALAACKLPDLPDGHCVLGYANLITPVTLDVVMNAALISASGTQGTATFTDLVHMPYDC
jgi:hypothetical protein